MCADIEGHADALPDYRPSRLWRGGPLHEERHKLSKEGCEITVI